MSAVGAAQFAIDFCVEARLQFILRNEGPGLSDTNGRMIYIRRIPTHAEYDEKDWLK